MKKTLGAGSGYLVIDHSDSPGLSPEDIAHLPLEARVAVGAVGPGEVLERDVQSCSHCQRSVVLNPGRVRSRSYCPHCHHYICDGCAGTMAAAGGQCVPFKRTLDLAAEIIEKHPEVADPLAEASAIPVSPTVSVPNPSIILTD